VSEHLQTRGAPAIDDDVQIVDRRAGTLLGARVESAEDGCFVLRLEQANAVPDEAPVRWFDGTTAWEAVARLKDSGASRVSCQIVPPNSWQPTPKRRSTRVRADDVRLLARVVSSGALQGGRRVQTECLDISATGCRARWPGRNPLVGDTLDLTWDIGGGPRTAEIGWVAARVARVIPLDSGHREVCFDFVVTKETQAARIREWHSAWLERQR
jgi:hypothetical protein